MFNSQMHIIHTPICLVLSAQNLIYPYVLLDLNCIFFQWLIYSKENNNMTVLRPKLKEYEYLIPTGKDKLHGVKLFLPNVSSEDEKEYTCLVGNFVGYSQRSFFLHVLPWIFHTFGKLLTQQWWV